MFYSCSRKGQEPKIKPPEIASRNPRYPSFADCVAVAVDMDKGRKVVATREVAVGEVVMTETPNTLFFCPETQKVSR